MIRSPKTHHVGDSRCRHGEVDPGNLPWDVLQGKPLVIEEKVDGSESSIYFNADLEPIVATRGEPAAKSGNFAPLWAWVETHTDILFDALGDRYILFGQWAHLKHTIFYDRLPPLPFIEEDIYDREQDRWLDTLSRQEVLSPLPGIKSVPVLFQGNAPLPRIPALRFMHLAQSRFQSSLWQGTFVEQCRRLGLDITTLNRETDGSSLAEGLYIKVEVDGQVIERYKWIRWEFLQTILQSKNHWNARKAFPNISCAT